LLISFEKLLVDSLVENVLRDCCQEGESVNLDFVDAKDNLVSLCKEFLWDFNIVVDARNRFLPHC
jgi:hypothetical protein